jgi:phenylacetate-coenzyme A ligase PaaK-like adenylate-forming protein
MTLSYRYRNLVDVARAVGESAAGRERERWPRERLLAFQHERLAALVAHASTHSPFYRSHYGGPIPAADVRLDALPPVTKGMMMDRLDDVFTDRRLGAAALEAHLATLGQHDTLFLDEYRVMASSGSSGRKGIYVYDRRAWSQLLAGAMRFTQAAGVRPALPRRRLASIAAPDAKHMTRRGPSSLAIGLFRSISLSAAQPLDELVAALNAWRPHAMTGYPSVLALLAAEQLAGRLRIAPGVVCSTSEVRTPEMSRRIRAAWSVEPHDMLGLTETGVTAIDCERHAGLHVFEDHCIYEVVDETGRPVPSGVAGARVLVTNLGNYGQPFIRFEVTDLVTVTDAPCDCGRTFRRITAIEGRADDILELPSAHGGPPVRVHPIHLRSPLTAMAAVRQYQITQTADGLDVTLALGPGASSDDAVRTVTTALADRLAEQGTARIAIRVRVVPSIEREAGAGKFKLIKAAAVRGSRCA